jgi:hypothetical protein
MMETRLYTKYSETRKILKVNSWTDYTRSTNKVPGLAL